jgi:tetratricopeptide (TPR) repeat protein
MSARFSAACILFAALLLPRGPVVQAKPPDLPVVKPVVCTPPAPAGDEVAVPLVLENRVEADTHGQAQAETGRRTLTRCLLFAAHPLLALWPLEELFAEAEEKADVVVDTSGGRLEEEVIASREKLLNAEETFRLAEDYRRQGQFDQAAALYGVVRRLCPGSRFDWMAEGRLRQVVAEKALARIATAAEEQDAAPPAKPASTCPYLQKKGLEQCPPMPGTVPEPASALENLNKLERAEQLYDEAESFRRHGQTAEAIATYEAVRTLCPGSRYDAMASDRLRTLPAGEEATEEGSPPEGNDQFARPSKPHGVSELLEACQHALHRGHYGQADALARRALALDVEAVEAHPLVYKMHLFEQLRRAGMEQTGRALRQPEFPPVDPSLTRTLEQVPREARSSGLFVEIDEAGGDEEQEAAVRPTEETRLFVKPAPTGLFLSEHSPAVPFSLGQRLFDLVKPGNCFELELTSAGTRGRFQIDLGSTGLRLTWERDGPPSLLIWTYGGSETGADR